MKIGFTGTQIGMTEAQKTRFRQLMLGFSFPVDEFHHGDCIGADSTAHDIVREIHPYTIIIIHPPINGSKRAYRDGTILPAAEYLQRNKDIVDNTDGLIATPAQIGEQLRSGTWSTIRYARKLNKPIIIIYPNGGSRTTRTWPV